MQFTRSDASYCSNNSIPPEQADAYDSTEQVRASERDCVFESDIVLFQSVKEAIKAVTMASMEVVVAILDSGIISCVPIPGLEMVAQVLVSTWNIVRTVSVSVRHNFARHASLIPNC